MSRETCSTWGSGSTYKPVAQASLVNSLFAGQQNLWDTELAQLLDKPSWQKEIECQSWQKYKVKKKGDLVEIYM